MDDSLFLLFLFILSHSSTKSTRSNIIVISFLLLLQFTCEEFSLFKGEGTVAIADADALDATADTVAAGASADVATTMSAASVSANDQLESRR